MAQHRAQTQSRVDEFLEKLSNKIEAVSKDGSLIPYKTRKKERRQKVDKFAPKQVFVNHVKEPPSDSIPLVPGSDCDDFELEFMKRFEVCQCWNVLSMRAFSDILAAYWNCSKPEIEPESSSMSFNPEDYALTKEIKLEAIEHYVPKSLAQPHPLPAHGKEASLLEVKNPLNSSICIQNDARITTPAPWTQSKQYPTSKQTLLFPALIPSYTTRTSVAVEKEDIFFDSLSPSTSSSPAVSQTKKEVNRLVIKRERKKSEDASILKNISKPILQDPISFNGSTIAARGASHRPSRQPRTPSALSSTFSVETSSTRRGKLPISFIPEKLGSLGPDKDSLEYKLKVPTA